MPPPNHQHLHGTHQWQQPAPVAVPQGGYPNPPSQFFQNPASASLDFSSVVSQQIMQDFLRLSTPVGSSQNDDTILAQALFEGKQSGKTYRQALEGLHGVNNHAANLWKDYYLDHHDRIDLLVSRLTDQPKTVKKPFVQGKQIKEQGTTDQVARKRPVSPHPLPHVLPPPRHGPKKMGRVAGPSPGSRRTRATPPPAASVTLIRPPKRPRATLNSLSAHLPSNDVPNLMPPQIHIPLPAPPSRSPTPPLTVQVGTNGNKYTKEDREFFIKFLLWRLKHEPSLTKKQICEQLHEKAPHHSANSWASHWHQRHDIADKILATYHNMEINVNHKDRQDEEEEGEVEAEIKDDQDDDDALSVDEISDGRPRFDGTFVGNTDADTEEDEADMGEPGSSFTRGDWCILARFIARNHWDEMSHKERWQTFTENCGTKRPGKSWSEFYRRNHIAILKLSQKYSPEVNTGRKKRAASSESDLDEDGEHETDYGEN